ncbi:MAG TPA: LuxR C-terminal-related transcriptional regulator [Thermoanaerobaculia bacterium]|nr:LuxR C-terminal-related transcriptional regulator [Thermoanaerobaculia bacterium]
MASPTREAIDLLSRRGEPAFAIDATDRVVYWNKACEELLGLESRKVLGKFCYDVIAGRDEHGNRYCYRNCPVAVQARADDDADPVRPFPLLVRDAAGTERRIEVSMFAVPAVRPSLSAVVHVIREAGAAVSKTESALAASTAAAGPPRWPILAKSGEEAVELTAREKEILRCLSEGMTTSAVARKLFIAPVTVRNHVQNILQKLDVHTKLAAVVLAYQRQIL